VGVDDRDVMRDYSLSVGPKTRILNIFRRIFMNPRLERWLVSRTSGRYRDSFWVRLMPPNYIYPQPSRRVVERRGIKVSLDIAGYIDHGIYFDYREEERELLMEIAANAGTVVDIGANNGFTALCFANQPGVERVIAFEPDPSNFDVAQQNVKLNDSPKVEVFQKGLGSTKAVAKLFMVNERNPGMNRLLKDASDSNVASKDIEIVSLDDFLKENRLSTLGLIKIDVEGYEMEVLRGAKETLSAFKPKLFIEVDDANLKALDSSSKELIEFLKSIYYSCFDAKTKRRIGNVGDLSDSHCDIFCLPDGD
jgi:FkbM family methyltransferase